MVVLILRFYQALFTRRSKSGKAQSEFASPKKAPSLVILCRHLLASTYQSYIMLTNLCEIYELLKAEPILCHARDPYSPARQLCEPCGNTLLEYPSTPHCFLMSTISL